MPMTRAAARAMIISRRSFPLALARPIGILRFAQLRFNLIAKTIEYRTISFGNRGLLWLTISPYPPGIKAETGKQRETRHYPGEQSPSAARRSGKRYHAFLLHDHIDDVFIVLALVLHCFDARTHWLRVVAPQHGAIRDGISASSAAARQFFANTHYAGCQERSWILRPNAKKRKKKGGK